MRVFFKNTLLGACFLVAHLLWGQSALISVGSEEKLILSGSGANEYLYVNGLSLQPNTAQYIISSTVLSSSSNSSPILNNSAAKVFNWSNILNSFSGNIYFEYSDAEISGLTESGLEIYTYDGVTDWDKATSVLLNTGINQALFSVTSKNIKSVALASNTNTPVDTDADGIFDISDNCPSIANPDQSDVDGDGIGDVCDNAPNTPNADQADTDGDGIADVLDEDDDNDGCLDSQDDLPLDASECTDTDADGIGDNADTDLDNDGVLNGTDNCPSTPNADQLDTDGDGTGDVCDTDDDGDGFSDTDEIACGTDPLDYDQTPIDTDGDGIPNCLDEDDDNDGYTDVDEIACGSDPILANSKPSDTDLDGIANCIDEDDDGDGVEDTEDAFPKDPSEWTDTDGDGIGNNADTDDDNDGQSDIHENNCGSDPLDASDTSLDTDADGIPDCIDTDDDGDGVEDTEDAFPIDPSEWTDTDADGIGNNADTDDDNDSFSDFDELACGSDPLDRFKKPADLDTDGVPDCLDEDRDGDGVLNTQDVFPDDPSESVDTDGDGLGDNFEVDDDNDGYLDIDDAFPLDPTEWADADGDGIGDNADTDDNNDGFEDEVLVASGVLTPNSSGMESTWKIVNMEKYPNARVRVYDRNGVEVLNVRGYKNDWRGTYKDSGQMLPAGSYYYIVDLKTGEKPLKGWLYITY